MKLKLLSVLLILITAFTTNAKDKIIPFTPEKILAKGEDSTVSINPYTGESAKARKGTVAATLNNIVLLNDLLVQNTKESKENIKLIADSLKELILSLSAVGMFDLFSPIEWASIEQPGRTYILALYLEKSPNKLSTDLSTKLQLIANTTPSEELHNKLLSILSH